MKKIIFLMFILTACQKENEKVECETCTLDVVFTEYGCCTMNWVEKSEENCKGEIVDGTVQQWRDWNTGGVHYKEIKTWHCK